LSIAGKTVSYVFWTISTSIGSRLVGLVGTLLLVRWISPGDYGVVSAASVVVASATQFSTLGVGVYVIAHPKAGRSVVFQGTVIHLVVGVLAFGATLALAGPLGPLFSAPTLYRYVPGLILAACFDRIMFMPERLMIRSLRFRELGLMRASGELAYTMVSVATAYAGFGANAVVFGNVARSLLRMVVIVRSVDRREWLEVSPVVKKTLRELAGYGLTVWIGGFAAFAVRRWDNLIVGHYFGEAIMGVYTLAYNLADIPAVQVGEQITDVLFASFVNMNTVERRQSLIKAVQILTLVIAPLAVGLGVTAPTIVHAFFPRAWTELAPMLMLLSALSVPRPIAMTLAAYLQAHRRAVAVTVLDCLTLGLLVGALCTIGQLGPRWACGAVGLAFTARMIITMFVVRASDGISVTMLLGKMLGPLLACVPMAAAVFAVRHAAQRAGLSGYFSLALEIAVGGLTYPLAALVFARQASREVIEFIRARRRRSAPAPQ
jgi:PST family polysaccharide transporter